MIINAINKINETASKIEENHKHRQRVLIENEQLRLEKIKSDKDLRARLIKKKELEWSNYYTEPDNCLLYKSNSHMVNCVNTKLIAKKEFESYWASKYPDFIDKNPIHF